MRLRLGLPDGWVCFITFFFPPEASSPLRFSGTGQRRDEAQEKEESKKGGGSMGLFAACVLCCYDTVRDALSCSYSHVTCLFDA